MADFKKFQVQPGEKIRLKQIDPGDTGKISEEEALEETAKHVETMERIQYWMRAEEKHSLLIVLQGMDAAGKDGVVRHVLSGFNPDNCVVRNFKQPTDEEASHDFLWRIHHHAPSKGGIAVFNRSHYETVLIERVHELAPEPILEDRYDTINAFERLLAKHNGTTILKFFLHISKEEQLARLAKRIEDPDRNWKVNENDFKEREFWKDYRESYELLLERTSTDDAPWFIIPANNKWFRNLAVSQIIAATLKEMKIKRPKAAIDIEKVQKFLQSKD